MDGVRVLAYCTHVYPAEVAQYSGRRIRHVQVCHTLQPGTQNCTPSTIRETNSVVPAAHALGNQRYVPVIYDDASPKSVCKTKKRIGNKSIILRGS